MPWVNAKVSLAGPAETGQIFIALKADDGSFNHWFIAVPEVAKEMLATALAAMNGDRTVTTFVTSTAEYSTIKRLYVRA